MKSLTNYVIDNRLSGRNITRVGDFIKCSSRILFSCDECGYEWLGYVDNIVNKKKGCLHCNKGKRPTNDIIDEYLNKNGLYKRLGHVIDSKNIFECCCIRCKKVWNTNANRILQGQGCPNCKRKSEGRIEDIIKSLNIYFIKQYKIFDRYKVDFFIPSKNIVVEYNGEQHYRVVNFCGDMDRSLKKFQQQQERDSKVRNYCLKSGIKLLEIPYNMNITDVKSIIINEIGENYV